MAEGKKALRERAEQILERLYDEYGHVRAALTYTNPWELLVATILSAQCTDVRVNMVTPALFEKYPSIEAFAAADEEELQEAIRSTGFFRNKAKAIKESAAQIVAEFGGELPQTIEELTRLRGVARKTASVVLQETIKPDGPHDGVVVDTHVMRLSKRMGLVPSTWTSAEKIEKRLMEVYPQEHWNLSFVFIVHGRQTCDAKKPQCERCCVADLCPQRGVKQATQ